MVRGFDHQRRDMVERQLHGQGIRDPRVLEAMARVPRHAFLSSEQWDQAYAPTAVEIGAHQTISQPYMVATMSEALQIQGSESVLEIGTGSGYQAAILAWLGAAVVTIERHLSLALTARRVLLQLQLGEIEVVVGDGSAPHFLQHRFDRIIVTAAAPAIPPPLLDRLAVGGRLVCPVGDGSMQVLKIIEKTAEGLQESSGTACRFVPLLGEAGF